MFGFEGLIFQPQDRGEDRICGRRPSLSVATLSGRSFYATHRALENLTSLRANGFHAFLCGLQTQRPTCAWRPPLRPLFCLSSSWLRATTAYVWACKRNSALRAPRCPCIHVRNSSGRGSAPRPSAPRSTASGALSKAGVHPLLLGYRSRRTAPPPSCATSSGGSPCPATGAVSFDSSQGPSQPGPTGGPSTQQLAGSLSCNAPWR